MPKCHLTPALSFDPGAAPKSIKEPMPMKWPLSIKMDRISNLPSEIRILILKKMFETSVLDKADAFLKEKVDQQFERNSNAIVLSRRRYGSKTLGKAIHYVIVHDLLYRLGPRKWTPISVDQLAIQDRAEYRIILRNESWVDAKHAAGDIKSLEQQVAAFGSNYEKLRVVLSAGHRRLIDNTREKERVAYLG